MATIRELLTADSALEAVSDSPRLDAELLLAHCLGAPRSRLYARPEAAVAPDAAARFQQLVQRRRQGEPVAYLRGRRSFWTFELKTDVRALVPRPETELLVSAALEQLPPGSTGCAADLGTGSGALALALAAERPAMQVLGTDISAAALALAAQNRHHLECGNLRLVQGDWCAPLARERFRLIVSNPPYLAEDEPALAVPPLCREPRLALASGPEGLNAIAAILPQALGCLVPGGTLLVEHAPAQAEAVQQMLKQHGYRQAGALRDLDGQLRAARGQRP